MKDIQVLIVDDSALVRKVLRQVLNEAQGMDVLGAVSNPLVAMDFMKMHRPDVLVLDIEMPHMDGLTFLRQIMATEPLPVVMCSVQTSSGSSAAMQALRAGAVEIVAKPTRGIKEFLGNSAPTLVAAVRAASMARLDHAPSVDQAPRLASESVSVERVSPVPAMPALVAIGASTGGTVAIERILHPLASDCAPIVVVQHMPEQFTRAFAERLDSICALHVKEAENGDTLRPGVVYIARGGHHLLVTSQGRAYRSHISGTAAVNGHRPSVDVLFDSVAACMGPDSLGIILTGMGADGAAGLLKMRQAGATTIAQDEPSCVVYGMPAVAVRQGAVDYSSDFSGISAAIGALTTRTSIASPG